METAGIVFQDHPRSKYDCSATHLLILLLHYHRHPRMNPAEFLVCFRRDYCEWLSPLSLRILPVVPQSSECKVLLILQVYEVRVLAAPNLLPFVEASIGNETTMFYEKTAEHRFLRDSFRSGIDQTVFRLLLFRPRGDETESHHDDLVSFLVKDYWYLLGRGDIVSWRHIGTLQSDHEPSEELWVKYQSEPTAHTSQDGRR